MCDEISWSPRAVVANILDSNAIIKEFEIQSRNYVNLRICTLSPLFPSKYR